MVEVYKRMYLHLFNRVTDALSLLNEGQICQAKQLLVEAQQNCENIYIEENEE